MSLIENIKRLFDARDVRWNFDGRLLPPSEEDIRGLLSHAVTELKDEPDESNLRVGQLIIEKSGTGFDVYVFAGRYNEGE